MLVCCGEALIDLVINDENGSQISAHLGGSPFNTARASALLDVPTQFFSAFSQDFYGQQLLSSLKEVGVDVEACPVTASPSPLAMVKQEKGSPLYSFYIEGSSAFAYEKKDFDALNLADVSYLQCGSFSLALEPYSSLLLQKITQQKPRIVSLDLNIRPLLIADAVAFRARFSAWLAVTDILKISDEDLAWQYPHQAEAEVFARCFEQGVSLILYTKGEEGAVLMTKKYKLEREIFAYPFVDAIAAGDTFHAAALAWLYHRNIVSTQQLQDLEMEQLQELAQWCSVAAAINCSGAGASPPTLQTLLTLLDKG